MNRDYAQMRSLIEAAKGQFVRVEFRKVDGTLRKMTVQPAKLKFHVKGDLASDIGKRRNKTYKANNPNLMPVWDVENEGIRSINFDTIEVIRLGGEVYNYGN